MGSFNEGFYFHVIEEMPEFLIAGKEPGYLDWCFTKKAAVKDAITDADVAMYTAAYTGQERLRDGFAYYRAYSESVAQNQTYQHQLTISILAIGAEQSQGANMGRAMQKIAAQKIGSGSLPNCGHYIVKEQPEQFVELLTNFLKRPGGRAPWVPGDRPLHAAATPFYRV